MKEKEAIKIVVNGYRNRRASDRLTTWKKGEEKT